MSRLGVLTLPFNNNYGGLLQSFALQRFLTDIGHEVMVIRHDRHGTPENVLRRLKIFFNGLMCSVKFRNKVHKDELSPSFEEFIRVNMRTLNLVGLSDDMIHSKIANLDLLIVGSDQVWRMDYSGREWRTYFFDFVKESKPLLISFAASFGVDKSVSLTKRRDEISALLSRFQAISVRELSGVTICKELFEIEAVHLLDPVLLLDLDVYNQLMFSQNACSINPQKGKIVSYLLDNDLDKQKTLCSIENFMGLETFQIQKLESDMLSPNYNFLNVGEWLRVLYESAFIFTDSFHGCVFAILFKKPFLVYGNELRGMTRLSSVLESFDLGDRLINSSNEITKEILDCQLNEDFLDDVITKNRIRAKNFLREVLNNRSSIAEQSYV
jgi:hypothetical protein